jgi:hypothetical protein
MLAVGAATSSLRPQRSNSGDGNLRAVAADQGCFWGRGLLVANAVVGGLDDMRARPSRGSMQELVSWSSRRRNGRPRHTGLHQSISFDTVACVLMM